MEPTPPQDPNPEHPVLAREQFNTDQVRENLKKFIDGEPMGTPKSKGFCDAVDEHVLIELVSRLRKAEKRTIDIEMELAALRETIRQRKNELHGYSEAYDSISDPPRELNLQIATGERLDWCDSFEDELLHIKNTWLEEAQKETLSARLDTSPPNPETHPTE